MGWLTSEYTAGAVPCVGFATKTNNDRIKSLHFWVTAVLLLLHQRTSRRCKKNPADECTVSVMLLLHQRTSRRKNKTADECTEKCYADFAPTHVTVVKKKLAK